MMVEHLRHAVGASAIPYKEVDATVDGVSVKRCEWSMEHRLLPNHRNVFFAAPFLSPSHANAAYADVIEAYTQYKDA